jgi:hypothetical protein
LVPTSKDYGALLLGMTYSVWGISPGMFIPRLASFRKFSLTLGVAVRLEFEAILPSSQSLYCILVHKSAHHKSCAPNLH